MAAVIGGIAVAVLSRSFEAFVIIAAAGTVVGYVVCLICVFGIGQPLAKRLSPSVADWMFGAFMLFVAPVRRSWWPSSGLSACIWQASRPSWPLGL